MNFDKYLEFIGFVTEYIVETFAFYSSFILTLF